MTVSRRLALSRLWRTVFALVQGLPLIFASGCAYRAGSGERQIPGGYRTIAVPVFKNTSPETGVEVYFTNALVREIQRSRIGELSDKSSAQVTIEGTIESVSFVPGNTVEPSPENKLPAGTILNTAYSIVVAATLRLRRNSDQKILWEGSFSKERGYQAPQVGYAGINTVNALYNHSARYQNIEAMSADMMSEAHDRLTENF